ncbi:PREDICTED: sodium/hydrogen exchanger 10-like [Nicrophorus vespilloides]|uniref:Sodium/hydrogen exchanger 10-like n=1 Tax=Nicrophorus vespilloides TaxID=110193 RepID=A0ABM1M848_NICVS|nr:PREDICTED: sodium/hydrogen exchanger 10-like [Nicrophorus vespilloides]
MTKLTHKNNPIHKTPNELLYEHTNITPILKRIGRVLLQTVCMLKDGELAKYKYLGTMLESETILTFIPVTICFDLCTGYNEGIISQWYHFLIISMRYIIGGIIVGVIMGKCTAVLMCWLYNEPLGALSVSIGMTFLTYYLCVFVLSFSGILAVVCVVCFIAVEKHRFSSEVDCCIFSFWGTLNYIIEIAIIMNCTTEIVVHISKIFDIREVYGTIITYFAANITRFFSFLLLGLLLNRLSYDVNLRCLMVLGWSGVKGNMNLLLILLLLTDEHTNVMAQEFILEVMVFTFLSLCINSTSMKMTLKLIGLSELSTARRTNMNNCMKFIMEKRICIINILKLNRYLSDANWSLVRLETIMKHPYKLKVTDDVDEDDEFMWNSRNMICPDCLKEVPLEISEKEMEEMLKDAQVKILKAKKVSVIKQYEKGTINKNCLQVLANSLEIMIESNPKSNSLELRGFLRQNAVVNCCDEIIDIISQLIEVRLIRDILLKQVHDEKHTLIKEMEQVQKERPWIAITVKTKQAIRTTLNAMEEALNELKFSGFVDNIEYALIYKEIFEKQKVLRNMKFVQPSPPKVIFNEVPWMAEDAEIIEFLYNHVQTVSWDVGEIVCKDGNFSAGVYIVVTGLLRLKYTPKDQTLEKSHDFGKIPIIDYLSTLKFDTKLDDNIMSGNSIGELSVLTGRPYDCTIVTDSPSQAYLLTSEVIKEAMKINSDPVKGLEARMWKCTTINLAVAVLMDIPLYQSFTQEQIKFKLERAFMPNLRCYKMFIITEMMDDIILLEGVASDYNSGDLFVAPMLIPRTIQKLILPRSSYLTLEEPVETRLLIIPMGDAKEYEIMEYEEEIAELVSVVSSSCLLHASQDQPKKKKKSKRRIHKDSRMLTKESDESLYQSSNVKFEILDDVKMSFRISSANSKLKKERENSWWIN